MLIVLKETLIYSLLTRTNMINIMFPQLQIIE